MGRTLAPQLLVAVPFRLVEVGAPPAVVVVPAALRQRGLDRRNVVHPDQSCRPGQKRGRSMRVGLARRVPARARVLAPVLAAAALLTLDPLVAVFALPEVMTSIGVVPEDLDRAVAIPAVFIGAAALAAWICRRRPLPARRAMAGALAVYAASSVLAATADSLGPLLIGRVVAGAAAGVGLVVTPELLADGHGRPGRLAAVLWGAFALAPVAANAVLSVWSWRGTYVLEAIGSALCALVVLRRPAPGIPRNPTPARSLTLSGIVGGAATMLSAAALATVLVYVPLFSRVTRDPESVGGAATVTWRAMLAFVLAAWASGALLRVLPARAIAVLGCVTAVAGLCVMASWDSSALRGTGCWFALIAVGAGLGVAVRPLAELGATADPPPERGLLGWLAGAAAGVWVVSLVGEARFNDLLGRILPPSDLCPPSPGQCAQYEREVRDAVLEQFQTVFLSAALCAAVAAVLVAFLAGPARRRTGTVSS